MFIQITDLIVVRAISGHILNEVEKQTRIESSAANVLK